MKAVAGPQAVRLMVVKKGIACGFVALLLLVASGCCTNMVRKQGTYRKSVRNVPAAPLLTTGDGDVALKIKACRERRGVIPGRRSTVCVDRYIVAEADVMRRDLQNRVSKMYFRYPVETEDGVEYRKYTHQFDLSEPTAAGWHLVPFTFDGKAATLEDLPPPFRDGRTTVQTDLPYTYGGDDGGVVFAPLVRMINMDREGGESWAVPVKVIALPVAVVLDIVTFPVQLVVIAVAIAINPG